MKWVKTVPRELLGLFVDDGAFAAAIVAWLAITGLVLPRIGLPPAAKAVILFFGLALILVESATRRARR